ncbi:MAG: endopeptidase La [Thermotogae bacterium]|nr:endopeptidase La [Thermotogota bacterium]
MQIPSVEIPEEIAILPIKGGVIFPLSTAPVLVGVERSKRLINDILATPVEPKIIATFMQKDPEKEAISYEDLYPIGTATIIVRMNRLPDGNIRVLLNGVKRIRLLEILQSEPYLKGRVEVIEEPEYDEREIRPLRESVLNAARRLSEYGKLPPEVINALTNAPTPGALADLLASLIQNMKPEERYEVLATIDVKERLQKVLTYITREIEIAEVAQSIQREVQREMEKAQREYYLREQLKAIQKELGIADEQSEIAELEERLRKKPLPEEVRKVAERELKRLQRVPSASPEYHVIRTYIEWILELPWLESSEDNMDLANARRVLDEDHYDLERVKERILEYIAIRKRNPKGKAPILCFVGPPGVGKTSLGKSIARALNKKFIRISLGGVRDEAEIRGHRRTYVGALPGKIISALRDVGVNNPVMMLDEIDKLGTDWRGDPASALLEVLDPEQNHSFKDHYLDLPFDLSKVFFITTANTTLTIPPPLLDRMEVIEIPGYTLEEKIHIAKEFLIPKEKEATGLKECKISFTTEAIARIVEEYTREAGVRELMRKINRILRRIALQIEEGKLKCGRMRITPKRIPDFLGPPEYYPELAEREAKVGVVTGLAWTPTGGSILFVEALRVPGDKGFKLTGKLGEVMRESAEAALTLARKFSYEKGVTPDFWDKGFIHLHVPSGAIPKDGPSAGITMFVALYSLALDLKVPPDVAMTGEITLRGKVLPVGGIKEKVLAADRAGIRKVLLPEWNSKDLEDVPKHIKNRLQFVFINTVEDALREIFGQEHASHQS